MSSPEGVTRLLVDVSHGSKEAADELLPLVYSELRRLARSRMARLGSGQTLQPTALVHEAYVRLVEGRNPVWETRAHFFHAAAEAMRRILIERARRCATEKHGGDRIRITLGEGTQRSEPRAPELLALDQALSELEEKDPAMGTVVKLRYFAGLSQEQTALAMGISRRTVIRLSAAARAWLADAMRGSERT